MTAAVCLIATDMDGRRYSDGEARLWLLERGNTACNRTFHTTARQLMKTWKWSAYSVVKFLRQLEAEGTLRREVLPDNGGTLITMVRQQAVGGKSMENVTCLEAGASIPISQFIENLPSALSVQQADRLSQAYKGIIYGEPGYDWATIEHLEKIEQALLPQQVQQAA